MAKPKSGWELIRDERELQRSVGMISAEASRRDDLDPYPMRTRPAFPFLVKWQWVYAGGARRPCPVYLAADDARRLVDAMDGSVLRDRVRERHPAGPVYTIPQGPCAEAWECQIALPYGAEVIGRGKTEAEALIDALETEPCA